MNARVSSSKASPDHFYRHNACSSFPFLSVFMEGLENISHLVSASLSLCHKCTELQLSQDLRSHLIL